MIEGGPITVCRRCGSADAQVVFGSCRFCDESDWELCGLIKKEDYIFDAVNIERANNKQHA